MRFYLFYYNAHAKSIMYNKILKYKYFIYMFACERPFMAV